MVTILLSLSLAVAAETDPGLTAVDGILVGHHTLAERPTGCTVVLAPAGTVGSGEVRGGAPATRETDLLRPENLVQNVHAVVLTGGSAFGLDAAGGVMRFLERRGVGFPVGPTVVPIVVGAALLDLSVGHDASVRPDGECGLRAATAASSRPVEQGSVGAGAGATVGKLRGLGQAMRGGVGSASVRLDGPRGPLVVAALVAVNSLGDVIDPATGRVIAGVRDPDGGLADARRLLRAGVLTPATEADGARENRARENTTIGVIATNALLTKVDAFKVAQMAHDGLARTIMPSHTPLDGDTLFVLATGSGARPSNANEVGALAAEVVAEAVLRAVRSATGLPGIPAVRDLTPPP